ncbi:hypothetical protein [Chitinimonas sp.]|uniref:hypothetical protein n=1 Tax=Chitinimonas sp. TaxID=1934313 RepID=UPI0035ADE71D
MHLLVGLLATMALAACAGVALAAAQALPARLVQPNELVRQQLQRAVQQLLGGAPIRLADDVLTRSDHLLIEASALHPANGLPLDGRARGLPQSLHLQLQGGACLLRHDGNGASVVLPDARCEPLPAN